MTRKVIEVAEDEYVAQKRLNDTVLSIMNNPEARRLMLKAQKTAQPDVVIPELDAVSPHEEALNKTRSELDALKKQIEDDKRAAEDAKRTNEFANQYMTKRQKVGRARGYTSEALTKIDELATQHGITDFEIAANHFDRISPPPAPLDKSTRGFGVFGVKDTPDAAHLKALIDSKGNDDEAVDALINSAITDVRQSFAA